MSPSSPLPSLALSLCPLLLPLFLPPPFSSSPSLPPSFLPFLSPSPLPSLLPPSFHKFSLSLEQLSVVVEQEHLTGRTSPAIAITLGKYGSKAITMNVQDFTDCIDG